MISDTRRRIELLRLRSVQFPPSPILCLESPLAQKGSGKGRKGTVELVRQIEEELSGFQWAVPPRAKMEIEFHFSSNQVQAPALHNLVKYYMDLLKGLAFRDDRQVYYLEAFRRVHPKAATKVFICFDRLSRRNQRLALYNRHKDISIDWSDPSDIWLGSRGIPPRILQHSILSHSVLGEWQQTGDPGVYREYVRMIQASDPFTVFLGDLLRRDEKEEYKTRIRSAFQRFARKYPQLQKLTLPIEVDIQVTPAGLRLGKDLDTLASG